MKNIFLILIVAATIVSCSTPQKKYPVPEDSVQISGDKIYYKDRVFAELRYIGIRQGQNYHGLSIYYYPYDKEVWIFPKEGWHLYIVEDGRTYSTIPEIKKRLKRYVLAKGFINFQEVTLKRGDVNINDIRILPSIVDVAISRDGRYVFYRIPAVDKGKTKKFLVEYGISEKIR